MCRNTWRRGLVPALAVCALVQNGPAQAEPQRFATPDEALAALVDALGRAEPAALGRLFGPEHLDELLGDDPSQIHQELGQAAAAAREAAALRPAGEDRAVAVIGRIAWPFPIPLVRDAEGWRFDTAAGIEEIIDRRIGRNELGAIEVARAYVDAQQIYAGEDRDGDRVLEYAQRLRSSPGQRDGLYWPTVSGEEPSPFGPFVAEVAGYLEGKAEGDPYRGYFFRVLTKQGPNAPGGAYGYVINGNMVAGFALLAWPAAYDETGIMTFLVGPNGELVEKDLGPDTGKLAGAIETFDPDPSWQPVVE